MKNNPTKFLRNLLYFGVNRAQMTRILRSGGSQFPYPTLHMLEMDWDVIIDYPPFRSLSSNCDMASKKKWKVTGPDQIPNAVWCAIHEVTPSLLTRVFNKVLREHVHPERWKKARSIRIL